MASCPKVPLSTLVDSVVKIAPLVVNHQGQFPSVTISFNLLPGTAIGQAVSSIQQIEKELGKPLSLQTSFQGNAQAFGASLSSTPILIIAALFVIYIILGVLYESLIHPITIISTLPSAGLGALLLLMAVHYDLSVIAIVGIILLIGIVKKNGIMLVDFAQHVEHEQGLTAEESIYRACIMRFRPILMTTMAALLGGVPMMLGTGVGSEICLHLSRPAADLAIRRKEANGNRPRRTRPCRMTLVAGSCLKAHSQWVGQNRLQRSSLSTQRRALCRRYSNTIRSEFRKLQFSGRFIRRPLLWA